MAHLFKSYNFKMDEKSISLLEGSDEGLFCWFTVNFLHGLYNKFCSVIHVNVIHVNVASQSVTLVLNLLISSSI